MQTEMSHYGSVGEFFGPAPSCVLECTYTPLPPPHLHHATMPPHLLHFRFQRCAPNEPSGLVLGFWPKTCNPGLRSPTCDPTTTITSPTPSHHPPHCLPHQFPMAHPKPSPSGPVLVFWPKTCNPSLRNPTRTPTAAVISSTTTHISPHRPPLLFPTACPKLSLVGRFQVFGPNPLPKPCISNQMATPPPPPPPKHIPPPSTSSPLPFHMARPAWFVFLTQTQLKNK